MSKDTKDNMGSTPGGQCQEKTDSAEKNYDAIGEGSAPLPSSRVGETNLRGKVRYKWYVSLMENIF